MLHGGLVDDFPYMSGTTEGGAASDAAGLGDGVNEDWHTKNRVTVEVSEDVLTGICDHANVMCGKSL